MSHSKQHGHSGKPKCVNRCPGRLNFTCCGRSSSRETLRSQPMSNTRSSRTHVSRVHSSDDNLLLPWHQEYNQYTGEVKSGMCNTHQHRSRSHTKTMKGEYCNAVIHHCIDPKSFESRSSICQAYNLDQQAF